VTAFGMLFLMLALVFTLIAVHEAGHFLAGLVAGIPARDMRIVLLAFPQHVALRDGDRWVSPIRDIERFIAVSRRHLASRGAAFLWVAGGMVFELTVTAMVCLASMRVGWGGVAFWVAWLSLSMYLINVLLMDLPMALRYRHAIGDTSGLWEIAKLPAVLTSAAMVAGRVGLVAWTAWR
jgi:hypothetical protein